MSRLLRCAFLTSDGLPREVTQDTGKPLTSLLPPPVKPPVDTPFVVNPAGVIADVWPAFAKTVTAFSPDGLIGFLRKSDEVSKGGVREIGEFWDRNRDGEETLPGGEIGHALDQSTGLRLWTGPDGKLGSISAQNWADYRARGVPIPEWADLELSGYSFADATGPGTGRLMMPRRFVSGLSVSYSTKLRWLDGRVEDLSVTITTQVGRGVYGGQVVEGYFDYDPRRRDPKNSKRKAGFLERNFITVSTPGKFWQRHVGFQDDANGIPVQKWVSQVGLSPSLERAFQPGVRVLPQRPPLYQLLPQYEREAA